MLENYHGVQCSDESTDYAQEYQNIFSDSVFVVNGFSLIYKESYKSYQIDY